jgi:talin
LSIYKLQVWSDFSIEAIAQEIRSFESTERPKLKCEAEDLIRATRLLTIATGKAVAAGKSQKQEDIIVAANVGRKAISDVLVACKVTLLFSLYFFI